MGIIIRLQHLPWSANAEDIRRFFTNIVIPDGGVHIVGGDQGDAFIVFGSDEDARQAMMKDGGTIKDSKVKLLLSSSVEMEKIIEAAKQQVFSSQHQLLQSLATATAAAAAVTSQPQYNPTIAGPQSAFNTAAAAAVPGMNFNMIPNIMSMLPSLRGIPGIAPLPMATTDMQSAHQVAAITPAVKNSPNGDGSSFHNSSGGSSALNSGGSNNPQDRYQTTKDTSRSRSRSRERRGGGGGGRRDRSPRDRKYRGDRNSRYSRSRSRSRSRDRHGRRRSRERRSRGDNDQNARRSSRERRNNRSFDPDDVYIPRERNDIPRRPTTTDNNEDGGGGGAINAVNSSNSSLQKTGASSGAMVTDPRLAAIKSSSNAADEKLQQSAAAADGQATSISGSPNSWWSQIMSPASNVTTSWLSHSSTAPSSTTASSTTSSTTTSANVDPRTEMAAKKAAAMAAAAATNTGVSAEKNSSQQQQQPPPFGLLPPIPPMGMLSYPGFAAVGANGFPFPGNFPMPHGMVAPMLPPMGMVGMHGMPMPPNFPLDSDPGATFRQVSAAGNNNNDGGGGRLPDSDRRTSNSDGGSSRDTFSMRNESSRVEGNNKSARDEDGGGYRRNNRDDREGGGVRRRQSRFEDIDQGDRDKYRSNDSGYENSRFSGPRNNNNQNGYRYDDEDHHQSQHNSSNTYNNRTGGRMPPSQPRVSGMYTTCVEVRNIPPQTTENDIIRFFAPIPIFASSVRIVEGPLGPNSRDAYVKFLSVQQKDNAINSKNGSVLNNSPVRVCEAPLARWNEVVNMMNGGGSSVAHGSGRSEVGPTPYMKINFVPVQATEQDIIEAIACQPESIHLAKAKRGLSLTAYIKLGTPEDVQEMIANKQLQLTVCGSRVKLEKCDKYEFDDAGKQSPDDYNTPSYGREKRYSSALNNNASRHENNGGVPPKRRRQSYEDNNRSGDESTPITSKFILIQNLPSNVTDLEILNFFSDIKIIPYQIHIMFNNDYKTTGEAYVEFQTTDDASTSLNKNNQRLRTNELRIKCVPQSAVEEAIGVSNLTEDTPAVSDGEQEHHQRQEKETAAAISSSNSVTDDLSMITEPTNSANRTKNGAADTTTDKEVNRAPRSRSVWQEDVMPPQVWADNSREQQPPTHHFHHTNNMQMMNHHRPPFGGPPLPPHTFNNYYDNQHQNTRFENNDRRPLPTTAGGGGAQWQQQQHAPPQKLPPMPDSFAKKPACIVALSNVPFKAEVADIIEFFKDFEGVLDSDVLRRYNSWGQTTGDARVCLKSPQEAQRAVELLDGKQIFNRTVQVELVNDAC